MKDEVAAAVVFLTRLVKRNKKLSKQQYERFSDKLTTLMVEKFKNHWHTERPHKGQAYRYSSVKLLFCKLRFTFGFTFNVEENTYFNNLYSF